MQRLVLALLMSLVVAGCAPSPYVRLPQLWPRTLDAEERAAVYHDPFPDDMGGPLASTRPRGFGRQRTAPRRAADLKAIHGLDPAERIPQTREKRRPRDRFSEAVSID